MRPCLPFGTEFNLLRVAARSENRPPAVEFAPPQGALVYQHGRRVRPVPASVCHALACSLQYRSAMTRRFCAGVCCMRGRKIGRHRQLQLRLSLSSELHVKESVTHSWDQERFANIGIRASFMDSILEHPWFRISTTFEPGCQLF